MAAKKEIWKIYIGFGYEDERAQIDGLEFATRKEAEEFAKKGIDCRCFGGVVRHLTYPKRCVVRKSEWERMRAR